MILSVGTAWHYAYCFSLAIVWEALSAQWQLRLSAGRPMLSKLHHTPVKRPSLAVSSVWRKLSMRIARNRRENISRCIPTSPLLYSATCRSPLTEGSLESRPSTNDYSLRCSRMCSWTAVIVPRIFQNVDVRNIKRHLSYLKRVSNEVSYFQTRTQLQAFQIIWKCIYTR
jgi:hypothetical protein